MATEVKKTELVYEGWAKYKIVTLETAAGLTIRREVEDHGLAACVLAYDPGRKTAMFVRQLRAPVFMATGDDFFLEVIAGLVDEDDPAEAARREAMEETGLRLRSLEHVSTVWPMPGMSTETIALYLAEYSVEDRIGPGGGVAHEQENIEPVEMALSALAGMADTGQLHDLKSLALLQTLRLRRPALFD